MAGVVGTAERNLLRKIVESEDGEIVCSRPGGWWVGNERVSGKVAMSLLRFCLISPLTGYDEGDDFIVYDVSSETEQVLKDPGYEPMIVRAMRTGKPQFN